ncbi:DEAD/DEAH box helicase [Terriglobus tenax]|uniref:DEAD/DEAH box helicase n=1 Tax=Terriglobus tenax TaxID=1111115 RepID=UPI0021DFAF46|nr:DEAD/DEAH box helicase [Terriglobus tenax]
MQEFAAAPLLKGEQDVILAAATSAGKTEAAFFPILTRLLKGGESSGFVLSISPLKALINDQADRLTDLCEALDLPVLGWHGDVSQTRKQKFLKNLRGVLIITPESLESLFVNKGTMMPAFAGAIAHIVVDELHSFLEAERGKQVQSLLHRLECAAGRRIPRAGLSATLGDKTLAATFLRPGSGDKVFTVDAGGEGYVMKLAVKGYVDGQVVDDESWSDDPSIDSDEPPEKQMTSTAELAIADYLFTHLRGSNHLIFPNSRAKVEKYADRLRHRSEREGVRNEFWTHHGSLSRELREESETALKGGTTSASAICTTTLELGIDIGNIKSVAQIGPPPSVASLRQRLGRSGRRAGEPAILRCFCIEKPLTPNSPLSDRIREGLVQTIAMVRLLMRPWVEPPRLTAIHASTFVQQALSVIAERGGATAAELWKVLVQSGTFDRISREMFTDILRGLGGRDILQQENSGLLLPGIVGEKLINHYDFYSAFSSPDEFRLIAGERVLGSLPITRPLTVGQRMIFGGRRWRVRDVDSEHKVIYVSADRGGAPPAFESNGGEVHDVIRQEMKLVLSETSEIAYLDTAAKELLYEARRTYQDLRLAERQSFRDGKNTLLFTWMGDAVNSTLAFMLAQRGLECTNEGVALAISTEVDESRLLTELSAIAEQTVPSASELGIAPEMAAIEKWDWALSKATCIESYASARLDLAGAKVLAARLVDSIR